MDIYFKVQMNGSHNSESSEVKQDSLLNSNFCILYIFSVEDLHE